MASDEEDRRYLERSMKRFEILLREASAEGAEEEDAVASEQAERSPRDEPAESRD